MSSRQQQLLSDVVCGEGGLLRTTEETGRCRKRKANMDSDIAEMFLTIGEERYDNCEHGKRLKMVAVEDDEDNRREMYEDMKTNQKSQGKCNISAPGTLLFRERYPIVRKKYLI